MSESQLLLLINRDITAAEALFAAPPRSELNSGFDLSQGGQGNLNLPPTGPEGIPDLLTAASAQFPVFQPPPPGFRPRITKADLIDALTDLLEGGQNQQPGAIRRPLPLDQPINLERALLAAAARNRQLGPLPLPAPNLRLKPIVSTTPQPRPTIPPFLQKEKTQKIIIPTPTTTQRTTPAFPTSEPQTAKPSTIPPPTPATTQPLTVDQVALNLLNVFQGAPGSPNKLNDTQEIDSLIRQIADLTGLSTGIDREEYLKNLTLEAM
ncbi:unnamed protein product, partial [Cyprideis torosa]